MAQDPSPVMLRHQKTGWWTLLLFLSLGLVLESLHGFKVRWYLDADVETRRFMWRLAHVHGTLLGLLNIVFALTLRDVGDSGARWVKLASGSLLGATLLMPLGFFLGGVTIYGSDPGLLVLLVPPGGALLLLAVFLTARGISGATQVAPSQPTENRPKKKK